MQRGNPQQKYYNATEMFILNQLGWGVSSGDFSGSTLVRNASLFGGAVAAFRIISLKSKCVCVYKYNIIILS